MYKQAFTIVELLVVIVVIAILSTVATLAYAGVSKRAENEKIILNSKSYYDSLVAYKTLNGIYPNTGTFGACLGVGYLDRDSNGTADCGGNSSPGDVRLENATLNAALSTIRGNSLPIVSSSQIPSLWGTPGSTWVGAVFVTWNVFTVNGVTHEHYVDYVLRGGSTNCGHSRVVESDNDNGGFPNMKPSTTGFTWTDGTSTECMIPLPL